MTSSALQQLVAEVAGATDGIDWSICLRDRDGAMLAAHEPAAQLPTASIGKVLLLTELARRIEAGSLAADTPLRRKSVPAVGEAGLWQHLTVDTLSAWDTAMLIGSFSDNLATNVLLDRIGLDAVQALGRALGLTRTALLDRVRDERGPDNPPHLSVGSADELSALMSAVARGTLVSPAVADHVRTWLATDADLSMVAGAFGLDPLAHTVPFDGLSLFHKTGSDPGTRGDVGCVTGDHDAVAYAVIARWPQDVPLRGQVLSGMRRIGSGLRLHLTQGDRSPR
jgi:beta-lactamase class A